MSKAAGDLRRVHDHASAAERRAASEAERVRSERETDASWVAEKRRKDEAEAKRAAEIRERIELRRVEQEVVVQSTKDFFASEQLRMQRSQDAARAREIDAALHEFMQKRFLEDLENDMLTEIRQAASSGRNSIASVTSSASTEATTVSPPVHENTADLTPEASERWLKEEQRRTQLEMEEKAINIKTDLARNRQQDVLNEQELMKMAEDGDDKNAGANDNDKDDELISSLGAAKVVQIRRTQVVSEAPPPSNPKLSESIKNSPNLLQKCRTEIRFVDRALALALRQRTPLNLKEADDVADPKTLQHLLEAEDIRGLPERRLREVAKLLLRRARLQQRERELLADDDSMLESLERWREHMLEVLKKRKRLGQLLKHFKKLRKQRQKPSKTSTLEGIRQLALYNFGSLIDRALEASRAGTLNNESNKKS
jgi:hypothetical protein